MATEKEFKLIGSFQDNITSKLKKLNREINTINKSFGKLQAKLRPIARDMGTIAMASDRVTNSLNSQKGAYQTNINTMRQYRAEVGRLIASNKRAAVMKPVKLVRPTVMPRVAGRAAAGATAPVGAGGTSAAAVAGGVFGVSAGNKMSAAMDQVFRASGNLLMKPFREAGKAFAERVGDEMSDIQAAGGMFALDQKNAEGQRLFKGFAEARRFQEELNRSLAKSAAALPGATSDYVRAAKGLTDTVMMAFQKDREGFTALAKQLGASADADSFESLTKVLQRFTEQTVLLGQGSGRGGMPLTMLMEQLIQRQNVNVQGMRMRYVQLRDNPLLASMLEEAQAEINATAAGSAKRAAVVIKTLDKALPQEVVNAMRNSIAGVQEAIRSGLLDPEAGLLGFGRELNVVVKKYDDFGKVVKENGKVVTETTTLFAMVRDSIRGFGLPIAEIVSILPQIFDPLEALGNAFVDLREVSMSLLDNFTKYTNFFKQNMFDDAGARGALAGFNKLLQTIGGISVEEAIANAKLLTTKGSDLSELVPRLFSQLMNSDLMVQIGTALGKVVGGVFDAMGKLVSGASDMASSGPFAKGFVDAFKGAGGPEGFRMFVQGIFKIISNAIIDLFKTAPLEVSMVAGLALLPSIIASAVGGFVTVLLTKIGGIATGALNKAKPAAIGAAGAAGKQTVGASKLLPGAKAAKALATGAKMKGVGVLAAGAVTLATKAPQLAKIGKVFSTIGKRVPGLNVAFAALDFGLKKLTGQDTASAASEAGGGLIGSVVGGAIGTAIAPGIGTAIGAVLGGFIGEWIGQKLPALLADVGPMISKAWSSFIAAVKKLPENIAFAVGFIVGRLEMMWGNFTTFLAGLPGKLSSAWSGLTRWFQELPGKVRQGVSDFLLQVPSIAASVKNGLADVSRAIIDWAKGIPGRLMEAFRQGREQGKGKGNVKTSYMGNLEPMKNAIAAYNGYKAKAAYSGGLFGAIAQEMRYKPAGSNLVIANDSETILNKKQTAAVANALGGGGYSISIGNINLNGVNNSQEAANQIAGQILDAIRASENSTIA